MSELIERSSLGTPEVRALREETPLEVRREILAGVEHPHPRVTVIVVPVLWWRWRLRRRKFLP